jgi:nucleotide-binding universal stress UspA family protein
MLSRILVPLDGSRFAEVATPVAVRLARDSGAALRFVLVHETRINTVPMPEGAIVSPEDAAAIREAESRYLEDVLGRLDAPSVKATGDVVDGMAATTLAEEIMTWKADLVVMATHGRGPVTRFWLGSVADYLLRHVATPVLLLRPRDEVDWPAADLHLKTILVPLDLSSASEAVLEPAIALALLHRAKVELVHVVEPVLGIPPTPFPFPLPAMTEVDDKNQQEAERSLAALASSLAGKGVEVAHRVLVGSTVASAVLEHVDATHPDLVALATHGRSGFRRALVGSVADKIIRGTHQPVLVVRPE